MEPAGHLEPAGQGEQVAAPAAEKVPGPQLTASTPTPHALPAAHRPLHAAVARPVAAPLVPAGHGTAVADVEPAGQ